MRKILILLIVTLLSCKEKVDDTKNVDMVDSTSKVPPIRRVAAIQESPTKSFKILARFLDSLGYSSDTVRVKRVKNYKELLDADIIFFDEFPFYKINKNDTKVLWWNTLAQEKSDSLDVGVFNQAENVWGYFYGKREGIGMTVDGVIEQWKFSNTETTQIAMEKLKACYPLPYFNTQPYYYVEGHFLFIFHTRASAFSYQQKDFFDKFKLISSAANGNSE